MRRQLIALLMLSTSCSRVPVKDDVASAIDAEVAKGVSTLINLDQLADFEWAEVWRARTNKLRSSRFRRRCYKLRWAVACRLGSSGRR